MITISEVDGNDWATGFATVEDAVSGASSRIATGRSQGVGTVAYDVLDGSTALGRIYWRPTPDHRWACEYSPAPQS